MAVRLHVEAERELRAAVDWYEDRRAGLGAELRGEVVTAFERITRFPLAAPIDRAGTVAAFNVRRQLVARFPYAVAYRLRADDILVVAIAHTSQAPGYWARRVR